jgi:hypothetical protein
MSSFLRRARVTIVSVISLTSSLSWFTLSLARKLCLEFAELYVDHVFRLHGLSREFITDRDSCFTSAFWQEVTILFGTRTVMLSSFHPQTDGQTEKVNQILETYLRQYVSLGLNDWILCCHMRSLPIMQRLMKPSVRPRLKLTYAYHPQTPVGEVVEVVNPASAAFVERLQSSLSFARKCLIAAQQRQEAFADHYCVEKTYKVGDKVLLSTKYLNLKHSKSSRKLFPKWIGPFEVVQVVGLVVYELEMNPGWRVHPVFHVLLLVPYRESGRVQPPPPPIEMEGALEYEVESILEHRFWGTRNPKAYYKVA